MSWLEERWSAARQERGVGRLKTVPSWFFDEATDRQLEKLNNIGLTIKKDKATKGEASDLIGLFEPPEQENEQILRFFKVSMAGMNQSRARYEVAKLFAQPENVETWASRPASQMQKEYYRYFGLKAPKSLTYGQAKDFIQTHQSKLATEEERKMEDWDAYESMFEEINNPDFREDHDLKAVSLSLYRSAIEEFKKEGKRLTELSDDIDHVVDKIIELNPDIQKR
jgi:hypothetical protein